MTALVMTFHSWTCASVLALWVFFGDAFEECAECEMSDISLVQKKMQRVAKPQGASDIVDLALGYPAERDIPSQELKAEFDARLAPGEAERALEYGVGRDLPEALGSWLGVPSAELAATNGGCMKTVELLCLEVMAAKRGVLFVEEASFWHMGGFSNSCPAEIVSVKSASGGYLDVENFESALRSLDVSKAGPARMLYLVSDFSNPMGGSLPEASRMKVLDLAEEFNLTVLADSVYRLLNYSTPPPKSFIDLNKARPTQARVFELHSFSKFFNAPGISQGWIRAHPALVHQFESGHVMLSNSLVQGVLAKAVADGTVATVHHKVRRAMAHRFQVFSDAMAEEGFPVNKPDGGYFFWVCTDKELKTSEFLLHGFLAQPGSQFAPTDPNMKKCIRICTTRTLNDNHLRDGAARLASFFRSKQATVSTGVHPL